MITADQLHQLENISKQPSSLNLSKVEGWIKQYHISADGVAAQAASRVFANCVWLVAEYHRAEDTHHRLSRSCLTAQSTELFSEQLALLHQIADKKIEIETDLDLVWKLLEEVGVDFHSVGIEPVKEEVLEPVVVPTPVAVEPMKEEETETAEPITVEPTSHNPPVEPVIEEQRSEVVDVPSVPETAPTTPMVSPLPEPVTIDHQPTFHPFEPVEISVQDDHHETTHLPSPVEISTHEEEVVAEKEPTPVNIDEPMTAAVPDATPSMYSSTNLGYQAHEAETVHQDLVHEQTVEESPLSTPPSHSASSAMGLDWSKIDPHQPLTPQLRRLSQELDGDPNDNYYQLLKMVFTNTEYVTKLRQRCNELISNENGDSTFEQINASKEVLKAIDQIAVNPNVPLEVYSIAAYYLG